MSFFDNNDFDSIVREFLSEGNGRVRRRTIARDEDEERVIDFIEDSNNTYLVFELPGFSEEDVNVKIEGNHIEVIAKKKDVENVKDYLHDKLSAGFRYGRKLPDIIKNKKFDYSMRNGILEIVFHNGRKNE